MTTRRSVLVATTIALGVTLAVEPPCLAESPPSPPSSAGALPGDAVSAAALLRQRAIELAGALREYRASLERLLAMYEQSLTRAAERQRTWRELYDRGAISRRELEQGEAAVATAQGRVDDVRRAITAADQATAEAVNMETLAALPPPAMGERQQTPALSRYQGHAIWSLPSITPKLQQLFLVRFGRALPISALGQTPMHDRMGFDHTNALDVAIHPDSSEGQALLEYLRAEGIPFIAYRGAVPGSASGAHIHVGLPSPRITVVTHAGPRHP